MTTVEATDEGETNDVVSQLEAAAAERDRLRDQIADIGTARMEAVASTYRNFDRLLERHREAATGYGDFEKYIAFQEELDRFTSGLDEDLPVRAAFEAADEILQKRRLSEDDFVRAREELTPAKEYADLSEDWEAARERYRAARGAVARQSRTLEQKIDDLRHVRALGAADLDAPVGRLREPIEAYNESVRGAFDEFRDEASAQDVFEFLAATAAYPLIEFRQPPTRLREFIQSADAGNESIATLLRYADFSQSKLSHYVDRPHDLQRHVATNRTYLERLDAEPLTVDWPPPPASELWWRTRERVAIVGRFAPDEVVSKGREVRRLARDPAEYGHLREAAHALTELDADERDRLRTDEVTEELEHARRKLERLETALETYPEL